MNYKTAQILRGAETIRRNSVTTDTPRTDTPRTDAAELELSEVNCYYCATGLNYGTKAGRTYFCGTFLADLSHYTDTRSDLCREREARQKAESEVERLRDVIEWSAFLMAETGRELTAEMIRNKKTLNPATEES